MAGSPIACLTDGSHSIEPGRSRVQACQSSYLVECGLLSCELLIGIETTKISQGHEYRARLAGTLDDDTLPGRGLVQQVPEVLADIQGADRSHVAIIAP